MSEKKRRGNVVHDRSPFVPMIELKTRKLLSRSKDIAFYDKLSGQQLGDTAGFWRTTEVDTESFVKVYVNGMKAMTGFTAAGARVFEVLWYLVQANKDKDLVPMSFQMVDQNLHPMSQATYWRGQAELIEGGVIAVAPSQGWFWYNSSFFFNGDRVALVSEYRLQSARPSDVA